jgi:hypothetical protein
VGSFSPGATDDASVDVGAYEDSGG